jgi:DNA processing protein
MDAELHSSPHPLTPPHPEDYRLSWLRLLRSRRVGIATFYRLMAEHGSATEALKELPKIARAAGVRDYVPFSVQAAETELQAGALAGAELIAIGCPHYPSELADITDAPPLLWAIGDLTLTGRETVSVVGARNASSLGLRMAKSLAAGVGAEGIVVVSGLARGIDTAAHLAALDTGTIAVLAGGVDVVYPAENASLAQEIAEKGLRLSEQPMGMKPFARHFPVRNRIISGFSRAVVVVEAAARSGSLTTARNALDQGREVLAVPGHPFDARASGCNMLLRDGATLVRGPGDVTEALAGCSPAVIEDPAEQAPTLSAATSAASSAAPAPAGGSAGPAQHRSLKETAALHTVILNRLSPSPVAEDQLIRDLEISARDIAPELLNLELEGKITRQPGGLLSRN